MYSVYFEKDIFRQVIYNQTRWIYLLELHRQMSKKNPPYGKLKSYWIHK